MTLVVKVKVTFELPMCHRATVVHISILPFIARQWPKLFYIVSFVTKDYVIMPLRRTVARTLKTEMPGGAPSVWFRVLPPEQEKDTAFLELPYGPVHMLRRDVEPILYFYLLFFMDLICSGVKPDLMKQFVRETNRYFLFSRLNIHVAEILLLGC